MHPGQRPPLDQDYFKRVIQDEHREVPGWARSLDLLVTVGGQKLQVTLGLRLGLGRGVALGDKPRGLAGSSGCIPR